ncbi:MAG: metal ABC transporter permease [Chloroflexi bacterium]|nr:metal ABC transporter permease [Chloroflexota bacterium]
MWDALQYDFMQNAVLAGLLASVACGIIGVYVVVNRIVFISGGISHTAFGGIGLGYYAGIDPIMGALCFTIAAALGIGFLAKNSRLAEDTVIGIVWAMGMALGILFIGLTPGYTPDLMSYLFGSILTVSDSDLVLMLILDVVILTVVAALYKEFLARSFDEEFGTVVGVPVQALYYMLLIMIALTVVLLIQVVGVILVIALLTIPAAMARQFTFSLKKMMILAILFGAVITFVGLWLSYEFDVASGATIILFGGGLLFCILGISKLKEKMREFKVMGSQE